MRASSAGMAERTFFRCFPPRQDIPFEDQAALLSEPEILVERAPGEAPLLTRLHP